MTSDSIKSKPYLITLKEVRDSYAKIPFNTILLSLRRAAIRWIKALDGFRTTLIELRIKEKEYNEWYGQRGAVEAKKPIKEEIDQIRADLDGMIKGFQSYGILIVEPQDYGYPDMDEQADLIIAFIKHFFNITPEESQ